MHQPASTVVGLGISGGVYAVSVLAQVATEHTVNWETLGSTAALIVLFGFTLTRRDPEMQKNHQQLIRDLNDKNAETIKHLSDKDTETIKHLADNELDRQKHLADSMASELTSQRQQFNLWMAEVLKMTGREVCHNLKEKEKP